MIGPRWKKVLGDLWSNKTRTFLVVFSIFIGVFAVGMITSSQIILSSDLQATYLRTNPSHATIYTSDEDSFGDDLVEAIESMDEVQVAEARRSVNVRVKIGVDDWRDLTLTALPDYDEIDINKIQPVRGTMPPPDKTLLIERSAMGGRLTINADVGDSVLIERPDGKQRIMQIAGVVHDLSEIPTDLSSSFYGYITFDTLEWLGENRQYNQIRIIAAGENLTQERVEAVANAVYEKIKKSGREPARPRVPNLNEHPLNDFITNLTMVMGMMGVMAVFLSGFLVTNTISGLLAQQTRQIGIMKSVGARSSQIFVMYMLLVLCFGLIALAFAVPLAQAAANGFSNFIAGFFNFDLSPSGIAPQVLGIQVFVSLFIPVLAAIVPVLLGTRVTIREALSEQGGSGYGNNIIDRLIQRIRGLPRPLLLSLRNTFRRKGRVTLTLITLTLGGAIFISIFSIRDSLMLTLDFVLDSLFNYDIEVSLDRQYRADFVRSEALRVEGVTEAETWKITRVRRVLPDGDESTDIVLFGVPPDTEMIKPRIVAGRWLLPGDENALVVSTGLLQQDTDINVGDSITLNIEDRDTSWQVVGVMTAIGPARWGYSSYDYYGRVTREVGQASSLRLKTTERTPAFHAAIMKALEEHLQRRGIGVASTSSILEARKANEAMFNFIVVALLAMSVLIAVVGGLGLMGTMSLNVLERTREIGVMRAIGASDSSVLQIFIVEGVILGMLSWLLAASISLPVSKLLSDAVGNAFFRFPLTFSFSVNGLIIWLVISVVLASIASFLPAWNASRVTVRDVLAYE